MMASDMRAGPHSGLTKCRCCGGWSLRVEADMAMCITRWFTASGAHLQPFSSSLISAQRSPTIDSIGRQWSNQKWQSRIDKNPEVPRRPHRHHQHRRRPTSGDSTPPILPWLTWFESANAWDPWASGYMGTYNLTTTCSTPGCADLISSSSKLHLPVELQFSAMTPTVELACSLGCRAPHVAPGTPERRTSGSSTSSSLDAAPKHERNYT